jgi:hypothetical protein
LTDSATLTGANGASATANASVSLTASTTVSLAITKTIPDVLDGMETQSFTFKVRKASDDSVVATETITFTAGQTSKTVTVSGLMPGVYYVTENPAAGWVTQPKSGNVDLSVQPDGTITCSAGVTFNNVYNPATARAIKTTIPTGYENGWTMCLQGPGTEGLPGGKECVTTVTVDLDGPGGNDPVPGVALFETALQDGGAYTITEVVQANWWMKSSSGSCSFTVHYPADFDRVFTCSFSNEKFGRIIVEKQTLPDGSLQMFPFTLTGGPSSLNASFSLKDGQTYDTGYVVKAGNGYAAAETVPAGWDLTSATCSDGSPVGNIAVSAGETVTCTFNNTQRGHVTVVKTVKGMAPPAGTTFTFQIRTGASATEAGTIVVSDTSDAAGNVDFNGVMLVPGTYQFCEANMMPGWHSSLSDMPGAFVPNSDDPMHDNSVVCVQFVLDPGEHQTFTVDNTPPPEGDARTIGFWKNWSSCTGGNQDPVLDETLAMFPIVAGQTTHGLYVGDRYVDTCREAVRLLNKSDVVTGKKMASDPLYNMAAQLLAAQLNIMAGAYSCPGVLSDIADAQALLVKYHFTGTGSYKPVMTKADIYLANTLAGDLDDYNNNEPGVCP